MDTFHKEFIRILNKKIEDNPNKSSDINVKELIANITPELVEVIDKSINESSAEMLQERQQCFSEFASNNISRWKSGFDLLESHIITCTEAGENINTSYRTEAVENNDLLFDLLVRHHARACHISNEILCLLKNGFPDAAHSRWRALHEVNATAMFLDKHGSECAERFYFHDVIDSYDGMKEHKKYEDRLQAKAPPAEIIEECKQEYDRLIKRYGKSFSSHYGWAAYIFPDRNPRTVGFATIEKDVGLDHMRPYYKWASQNIHAGSKGMRERLALAECNDDILVVGQSNSGMTDPAHATALSLMQVTCVLLKSKPTLDHIVLMEVIRNYADRIGQTFLSISKK
ncbi:DUF5677 domain-containing protein [Photobacterium leiognathi subsp. mandapamensis]|uniref:DUF5677 domain-containing protein n=1 Tax=Photobacterium leiognathi TaxID=553611 RepID=UPI002981BC13|nr:DUF5677 domain-containing protein [Photobacterium leiognathi]